MGKSKKPKIKAKKLAKSRASLAQEKKDPDKMTLQERKQNIQKIGESLKMKLLAQSEMYKDAIKGVVSMYTNELYASEEKIEEKKIESEKYKKLLTKHKIKH